MPITIEQYIEKYDPCPDSIKWAHSTGCTTMQELFVHPDMSHEYALLIATRMLSDRDLRLFTCWCVRQVWQLLDDESSREAVEVAERYAVGEATDEQLSAAADAAICPAYAAVYPANAGVYAARAAVYATRNIIYATRAVADAVRAAVRAAVRTRTPACAVVDAACVSAQTAAAYAAQIKQLQTYELTDEMR